MSAQDWRSFAKTRIYARNGNLQAAWIDVLNATALLTALDSPQRAARTLDRAIEGFRAAEEAASAQ
jgi:hypothetical protein